MEININEIIKELILKNTEEICKSNDSLDIISEKLQVMSKFVFNTNVQMQLRELMNEIKYAEKTNNVDNVKYYSFLYSATKKTLK